MIPLKMKSVTYKYSIWGSSMMGAMTRKTAAIMTRMGIRMGT